jgi:predicted nucleotide-binding protein (sugar kinase/HSP70/actin superfamily)
MKLTFPHMGNMYISVKVLLDSLKISYVVPPNCNKKTLAYGTKHSPESICLPFKIILGDFLQGIENGADTVLFGGGCGQCRLGYYGDLFAEILKDLGYQTRFINLELKNMSVFDIIKKLKPVTQGIGTAKILKGILLAFITVFSVDRLQDFSNQVSCREINRGQVESIMKMFHKEVKELSGFYAIRRLILQTRRTLLQIPVDKSTPIIRIAIVGEIYTAAETFANLDIEKKLCAMGVEVTNYLGVGMWIREHMVRTLLPFSRKNKAQIAANEYIKTDDFGGHGIESIGNSILSAKNRFDGVIHLFPLTCMPEIIAQSTFSTIQHKYNIPIMSLIVDEMTGEAGYMTRLEAFVDLLKRKKEIKEKLVYSTV